MQRKGIRKASMAIAYCGMACALSVVFMTLSNLVPVMTYASPLLAGILLPPLQREFGRKYAWSVWLAASVIIILIGPDKEAAFFYFFIGWYPLVKWYLQLKLHGSVRLAVKVGIFAGVIILMYSLLEILIHINLLAEMGGMVGVIVFVAAMVLCMLIYDFLLERLMLIYDMKLRRKLGFKS